MANNPDSLGDYELHFEREGFASIRQLSSGEIMHLRSSPIEEARQLYLEQSGLAQLLARSEGPIVVWDVGLGAAANAIAAIECYEQQIEAGNAIAPLTIMSFENDLDSLALALRNRESFPYLHHPAPSAILKNGSWHSKRYPNLKWLLVPGDFAQTISKSSPPPDIVFYDMFSSKNYPEQWTLEIFRQLFAICKHRATRLVTYSRSTSARAALLAAGFYVARGRASGAQEESTIALTSADALSNHAYELLDSSWLGKWERSRARYPAGLPEAQRAALEERIRKHPQFQSSRQT
jgi:queuine tRNA-ribosyltransferase